MGKHEKLLQLILSGRSDANIEFDALCRLLTRLGFEERTKGSHHVFRKNRIKEKINIQKSGSQAKPYQVKQIRDVLVKYQLAE